MQHHEFLSWCHSLNLKGYVGSYSFKKNNSNQDSDFFFFGNPEDKFLHAAIYEIDPEYQCVAILEEGYSGDTENLPCVSKLDDLDDAVLYKGIGHTQAFKIKETGAIACFSYNVDRFLTSPSNS